jgi:hypothetical protein
MAWCSLKAQGLYLSLYYYYYYYYYNYKSHQILVRTPERLRPFESVDGRVTLKWIVKETGCGDTDCNGLKLLKIGTRGGLL